MLRILICVFVLFFEISAEAQTFYLTNISPPLKLGKDIYPKLEDPKDETGDVAALTIKKGIVYFNGEYCGYQIEHISKFSQDKLLGDLIDDMGGDGKFNFFLERKLKTKISDWKSEIFLKRSTDSIDARPCALLQNSMIYMSNNEIILWDLKFFYRFLIGKDFSYRG